MSLLSHTFTMQEKKCMQPSRHAIAPKPKQKSYALEALNPLQSWLKKLTQAAFATRDGDF